MKTENLHRLIWMSRPLMQAAESCVESGLIGTGLTVRMRAVLEILHHHGAQTVPDIAAKLEIQRQYVQLMCNETLASGFVEVRPNPRHKRSSHLALTEQGRALIEQILSKELSVMEDIGADLTDEDVAKALEIVVAVTGKLKNQLGEVE